METSVAAQPASFQSVTLSVHTRYSHEFVDITDMLVEAITESGIANGLGVVTSLHTTAAIVVNEHEPELLKDLDCFLKVLAPEEAAYAHNAVPCLPGEHPNGHAHCQALLLSTSASFPILAGQPCLGRYQRVFLVELDHERPRRISLTILGS